MGWDGWMDGRLDGRINGWGHEMMLGVTLLL